MSTYTKAHANIAERDRTKAEHDFDVKVLAPRALAELLGAVHDLDNQHKPPTPNRCPARDGHRPG